MSILIQFLLRLSFGLAAAMGLTSSALVSSGFFRNHLYVTLGLTTLAALVATNVSTTVAWSAGIAAVLSYVGAVAWLYEAKTVGKIALWAVAVMSFFAAWAGTTQQATAAQAVGTSGLVLGFTFAAMLLGHWYLNSPGMELAPLRRLLKLTAAAVGLQALASAFTLVQTLDAGAQPSVSWWLFVLLRWSFGIIGIWALLWMAWQTLKIPNTQSATGILYVAVMGAFVGELAALLLSAQSSFPV